MVRRSSWLAPALAWLFAGSVAGCAKPSADPPPGAVTPSGPAPGAAPGPGEAATQTGPGPGERWYRLEVDATFEDLPAGAIIVAPSARDLSFQRVARSEHRPLVGTVVTASGGGSLYFVAKPTTQAGTARYQAAFEVRRGEARLGDLETIAELDYPSGPVDVGPVSSQAAVLEVAAALGEARRKPVVELHRVLARLGQLSLSEQGTADPVKALAGEPVSAEGSARSLVELMRLRGVPAQLAHGWVRGSGAHVWAEVKLPKLGWVPVDPWLALHDPERRAGVGSLPADRVTLAVGDSVTLPAEGGALTLTGLLAEPRALVAGARFQGRVSWSVQFTDVHR